MKIITWNVNGIRAVAKKGFKEFIENKNADFYCLQEVKAFQDQYIKEIGYINGYTFLWHTGDRAGYGGTAIIYKENMEIISKKSDFEDIGLHDEGGRVTEIEFKNNSKNIVLLNVYFPNGGTRADGTEMLSYKLSFYDKIINYVNSLVKSGKDVIVTGDFNICHTAIDIARPKENENSIGFLPIERAKISEFLNNGYIDTWRYDNPNKTDVYSWWSYRAGARPRNVGWRLDYFLVNKSFIDNIDKTEYLNEIMGSDHCPVMLKLK